MIMDDISDKRKIEYAIENAEEGTVFGITDFTSMASYDCVQKVLRRLAEEGKLRRIMRGIYEKPQYNEFLGEYMPLRPTRLLTSLPAFSGGRLCLVAIVVDVDLILPEGNDIYICGGFLADVNACLILITIAQMKS